MPSLAGMPEDDEPGMRVPFQWTSVAARQPKPHAKYMLRRGGFVHTVTPCYGMHKPWWVPMGIHGQEYGPAVDMLDTDEWLPL